MSRENPSSTTGKLSFKKLPANVQERLSDLLDPDDDRLAFKRGHSVLTWIGLALPLLWFAYLLFSTRDQLWANWMFWANGAVTLAGALILAFSLAKLLRGTLAGIQNADIFTTDEFITIHDGSVESINLADIDAVAYLDPDRMLEVWIGAQPRKLRVYNDHKASRLEKVFSEWKAAAKRGFLADYAKPEFAYNSSGKTLGLVGVIAFALILGIGFSFLARGMNRGYDDEQTWKSTAAANTVQAYEDYQARHPNGAHVAESREHVVEMLGKLKADYFARAKDTANQKAVTAFGELLDEIARKPHATVYIKVTETRDLDDKFIDKIKKEMGVNPYTYDQAMPVAKADYRKNLIFEKFKSAFGQQLSIAPVNFEMVEEAPAEGALMQVDYTIKTENLYYTYWTYSSGGRSNSYYPGAKWIFNFTLRPDTGEPFETTFENAPKVLNTGIFREEDSGNYSFDAVLFGLVSDNFRNDIQRKFGFISITNS